MTEAGNADAGVVTLCGLCLLGLSAGLAGRRTIPPRATLWTLLETRNVVPEDNHGR